VIDISSAISTVMSRLKKLSDGHYVELLTFKKDRSIRIVKISDGELLVVESGYARERLQVAPDKLKTTLKKLIKKEFPRSNKLHLNFGEQPDS